MSTDTQTWLNVLGVSDLERITDVPSKTSAAIQPQYAHAPRMTALAGAVQNALDATPQLESVLSRIADPKTACGAFLDWIGDRVGADRVFVLDDGSTVLLDDEDYRFLIMLKALSNISASSIQTIEGLLDRLLDVPVWVADEQDMTITVRIFGRMTDAQFAILRTYGIPCRPAGVLSRIYYFPEGNNYFGFLGSDLQPFNQAIFYNDDGTGGGGIEPEPEGDVALGIPIGMFLGDPDEHGILQAPSERAEINTGVLVTHLDPSVWRAMFKGSALVLGARFRNVYVVYSEALREAFMNCANLAFVRFDVLEELLESRALFSMAEGCTSMTALDLPKMKTVGGQYAMSRIAYGDTALLSVGLDALETVSGAYAFQWAFQGCTALKRLDFHALKTVSGQQAFDRLVSDCASLEAVTFPVLETISGAWALTYFLYGCVKVKRLDFPALRSLPNGLALSNLLVGSSVDQLHFAAAAESIVRAQSDFANGFGRGDSVQILFDL